MQTLLLTGATGFIGAHVARRFAGAGYKLRVLTRPTSDLSGLDGLDFERVIGDITDPDSLPAALDGVDGLIHMAGCTSFVPSAREKLQRINVRGTTNVLEAALAASVKRALYTSSFSAVGASEDPSDALDESAAWDARGWANHYVISKYDAEQAALSVAEKGLSLVMVNPTIVWGPGDRYQSSTAILLAFCLGEYPGYMNGGSAYVDVRDVADGHLAAWEKGAVGQRYILSAENLHNRRLVEYAVRLTGAKKVGRIPYPLALAAAAFNEKIVARFKPEAADFNRAVVRTGSRYWYADARRSREALGVTYRPIDETALDTLRWSAQNGLLPITNSETRQLLNG